MQSHTKSSTPRVDLPQRLKEVNTNGLLGLVCSSAIHLELSDASAGPGAHFKGLLPTFWSSGFASLQGPTAGMTCAVSV